MGEDVNPVVRDAKKGPEGPLWFDILAVGQIFIQGTISAAATTTVSLSGPLPGDLSISLLIWGWQSRK